MLFPSIFLEYLEEKIGQSEFYKPELCEMSAEYKKHFCLQFQKPHHTAVNKCSHRDSAPHSIRLPCRKQCLCRQCLQPSPSRHTRLGGDSFPCRPICGALFWYLCKVKVCLLFTLRVLSPSTVITSPTHCVCSSDVQRKLQLTKERDRLLRSP